MNIRQKVNKDFTTVRLIEDSIKKAKPSKIKLGDVTIPNIATDVEVMFLGAILENNNKQSTALSNRLAGLTAAYPDLPKEIQEKLLQYKRAYDYDIALQKIAMSKIIATHPLSIITKIKGVTDYSLGIVMSMMKDPRRFPSPSNLFVYAGVAPKYGHFVSKANIALLRKLKQEECGEDIPDDFQQFGFHTSFKGRMYNIVESMLKAKGFFYHEYTRARLHLEKRAMNNEECFKATEQDVKNSNGVMTLNRYYMKDKKNQSLEAWSDSNARWRQARTLLHLIYCEWLSLFGQQARELYSIEYLGHQRKITLQEVLNFEQSLKDESEGSFLEGSITFEDLKELEKIKQTKKREC